MRGEFKNKVYDNSFKGINESPFLFDVGTFRFARTILDVKVI